MSHGSRWRKPQRCIQKWRLKQNACWPSLGYVFLMTFTSSVGVIQKMHVWDQCPLLYVLYICTKSCFFSHCNQKWECYRIHLKISWHGVEYQLRNNVTCICFLRFTNQISQSALGKWKWANMPYEVGVYNIKRVNINQHLPGKCKTSVEVKNYS